MKDAQGLLAPDLVLCRINENVKRTPSGGRGGGKQRQVVEEPIMINNDHKAESTYFQEADQLWSSNYAIGTAEVGSRGGGGRGKQRQVPQSPPVEEEGMSDNDQEEVDTPLLPLPPIDDVTAPYLEKADKLWSSNYVIGTTTRESTVEEEGSCLMEVQIQPTSASTSASRDQPQPQSSAASASASASASTSASAARGVDLGKIPGMGMRMETKMGVKFELSDEEALHYLFDKAAGRLQQPYTVNGAVTEEDLYGEKEPWVVFMEGRERPSRNQEFTFCNQEFRYYYTTLKRMQRKEHGPGERFLRTVGKNRKGTWSGQDKPDKISNDKGQLLGFKKCYAYKNKGSPQHGRWLMKEYSLDGLLLNQLIKIERAKGLPVPDLVLCRIHENVKRNPSGGGGGGGGRGG